MSTPHNEANLGNIAKTVIMPGDPLRAKYIAENFLDDYELVNSVRGMYCYTGHYKGKELSVMAHGMGMPSIGIYCYELYKFYDVENIIRIGSCGGYLNSLKLFDIILATDVFSETNFALSLNNDNCHIVSASKNLNKKIIETAKNINTNLIVGTTMCTDCFDLYMTDVSKALDRVPKGFDPIGSEMEAFALFYIAKMFNRNASCLMSVVDLNFETDSPVATTKERQTGLNNMITLALESTLSLEQK